MSSDGWYHRRLGRRRRRRLLIRYPYLQGMGVMKVAAWAMGWVVPLEAPRWEGGRLGSPLGVDAPLLEDSFGLRI